MKLPARRPETWLVGWPYLATHSLITGCNCPPTPSADRLLQRPTPSARQLLVAINKVSFVCCFGGCSAFFAGFGMLMNVPISYS